MNSVMKILNFIATAEVGIFPMKDAMDDFVDKLQEQIFEESKETYGEEVFSRWQNPRFMGKMTDASSVGRITGPCGDTMEIYLRIRNDHIEEINFFTDGCGSSVACGSMAAELAGGKGLDEAAQIGGETILEALKGLPEEEVHCAKLAAETLQVALHEWMLKKLKLENSKE
jgi:nitrogen fixation NifU-like protein